MRRHRSSPPRYRQSDSFYDHSRHSRQSRVRLQSSYLNSNSMHFVSNHQIIKIKITISNQIIFKYTTQYRNDHAKVDVLVSLV